MVNIVFSQEENKFCFNQPITPTSVIGGAEGGITDVICPPSHIQKVVVNLHRQQDVIAVNKTSCLA